MNKPNLTINPQTLKAVFTQEEGKNIPISGVKIFELKNFVTEDGYFIEMGRYEQGISQQFKAEGFEVKQINISKSSANTVKAWHFHYQQEDVWFVPPESKLLIGLADLREDSPTKNQTMRVVLGEGIVKLLYIPRGVAHGYRNLKNSDSFIIYFVNNYYNSQQPDEQRLPWDHFGADFWEVKKG